MPVDRTVDVWGRRTPHPRSQPWPERTDQFLTVDPEQVEAWVPSACVLCSNGCGLDIAVAGKRIVGVRGRATDRVNHGRLGPKGLYGWQGQLVDRLEQPLARNGSGDLVEVSWDEAMRRIVERSQQLLNENGPRSHAFYTSGQLMLEEYYTLAVVAKAGIATPHTDGNTRLCTATAASALKETFGSDGQPASYADIDVCDALFLYGHNVAATQTVLWARVLDRLEGSDPMALVCVDPRRTPVARKADVHLAIRGGTNLALVNGLAQQLISHGWTDPVWIRAHTVGYAELEQIVAEYPPSRVAEICDVRARDIEAAAEILGTARQVVSTVLQGFYQSHQATAASCGVNNLHLLRGLIGKPGCGVLQMNGQPTAQNARECGANGDLPGFRNWANASHVAELAQLWDVDEQTIPSDGPPTHAMRIFQLAEEGPVRWLWIAGTNPAVSLPDLARVRAILSKEGCFVVVSDGYLTETAELADVVLPAALWGEKTGTYTNADRTVHLSPQAAPPPGSARSDFEIWLDYARRMGFRTKTGRPLPWWSTPEEAFEEWKRASAGRPCDYTGLTYERLRTADGVQWPCTPENPAGTERLYTDHRFTTSTEECENYGHDLLTGETVTEAEHRAVNPAGRAFLKAVHSTPPPESPTDEYPFVLNTGRVTHHFHTRTKTGRAPQLNAAEPHGWVEVSAADAERLGIHAGQFVRITTRRGQIEVPARIGHSREGTVFVPFHYGRSGGSAGPSQAANELTLTTWDPVSKQPSFKTAAARIEPVTGTS